MKNGSAVDCCATALRKRTNEYVLLQVSTNVETMYFIADSDKEKEDWINAIGRAIVRHSASLMENEAMDY